MEFINWNLQPQEVFAKSPVIPVVVINDVSDALALAEALIAGGVNIVEITMRTPEALRSIEQLRIRFNDLLVGAGTILNPQNLQDASAAGAQFAISPGITRNLLIAGINASIPFIPGVSSLSDAMQGLEFGYHRFKFFPAEQCGGIKMLQAIHGPLPDIKFCPTGGINAKNMLDYLALPNVECVGGSWLVAKSIIDAKNWQMVTELSQQLMEVVHLAKPYCR